ncbi:MAG: mechanosensitive ion channel family protein [Deltaproteobacteria bacterium]|nr:mechanosensitive ion channel family protein [Deltaproteobacteria bacterium]
MTLVFGFSVPVPFGVAVLALSVAGLVIGHFIGVGIVTLARRAVGATKSEIDDLIVDALARPIRLASMLVAIWLLMRGVVIPPSASHILNRGTIVAGSILVVAASLALANRLVPAFARRNESLRPAAGTIRSLVRLVIIVIGVLMVMDAAGISVAPVLATLGVGSVAIALALKDTLTNFFAGLYILIDRPFRPGDHVKIEATDEGIIESIGLRSTRILTPAHNLVVVPNGKLALATITNFSLPSGRAVAQVRVSISHDSDVDRVESLLADEVGRFVRETPTVVAEPAPWVRCTGGPAEVGVEFAIGFSVANSIDQALAQHDLRKRLLRRLKASGLNIAAPQKVPTPAPPPV